MCITLGIGVFIGIGYLLMIFPGRSRRQDMKRYFGQRFAHRGFHFREKQIPENSMPAFQRALTYGMGIELDVHLSKDGQVVVFHDDTLERLCGVQRHIEEMTWQELKMLSLDGTGHRIPLLREVLEMVDGRVPLLIELKLSDREERLCAATWRLLKHYHGAFLIQSFNSLGLLWFRKHAPHVLRGQLSSNLTKETKANPFLFRFVVRFLLTNWMARPDFIAYRYRNRYNLSLLMNRYLYRTPIALWTLKKKKDYEHVKRNYHMMIFEELS